MRSCRNGRPLALGLSALLLIVSPGAMAVASFAEVKSVFHPSDIEILDRHGEVVQSIRVDQGARRLPWVRLEDVSPAMRTAIVLSEDQRFWQHSGVDWQAVAASAWANLWNRKTRGASTVTMQLAGLLADDLSRPSGRRSVVQKVSQAWMAGRLEAAWRKSDILEAYLNLVPFRGELVGLPAMTQMLFGKYPDGLDAREAAIAAALVRGPNAAQPTVTKRACQVLTLQRIPCAGLEAVVQTALTRRGGAPLGQQIAPHFARQVLKQVSASLPKGQVPPPRVMTTLDARWQRLAISLLRQQLSELSGREVEDGAVLVLDNQSGDVLAWVGSSGGLSDTPHVDAVLARRQPGSTLKPFVYGLAFEKRLLTPASLLYDSPVQLPTGSGFYVPQNYDRQFKGWVSVRTALGNSLNVPAVRAGAMLGVDAVADQLNRLGLALQQPAGFYGPGLALGSAEVTLRDLSNAYRSVANAGWWSPVRLLPGGGKQPRSKVMSAAVASLLSDILSDNTARSLTFGLDSVLATRGFAAVKTGTSKDMRDNWCMGYTSRYTVGVWVGNTSGSPMHDVSGVSGAAPLWAALVRELHRSQPSITPALPAEVVRLPVHFERQGNEPLDADRSEVFLRGTEMAVWRLAPGGGATAERTIHSPQDGAIFALDPDMPVHVQKIALQSNQSGGEWWLDGRKLSSRQRDWWQPWPGRHELAWRKQGRVVDTIRFEVRGAGLKVSSPAAAKAVGRKPAGR
ncbi:penicillin-binding protein 1C [Aquabacterium sp.]|uniref:penicillin-binding protein 1C n=1 Tax=Aquabacterium sp. TaxID=1872578 RepID=UPI0035B4213F